jgi:hypothetical protein
MEKKIIHFTDSSGIDYQLEIIYPYGVAFFFKNNHYSGSDNTSSIETMWVHQIVKNNAIQWSSRPWWILPSQEAMNYFDSYFRKFIANKVFW